ncbi:Wzz/FepE/Etk N-terminal domain-containing protein [Pelomonas sp. SE-A7]|uniref:Wzz/FepE/Etk N-terminal domain-containing protein n=1 Tax=Pelomonas sp. SE-A7 TaxID=3054953 RepID=UPI00259C886A|nr:Wzz/FepE/Etk N-terminal domain-containing protein [Pelomonas sp. SE-A7]MDM4767503.1 Wzz/FepE/Etk N-terminal domain-containing protein [Pelomonas sp. SE-A7]
MDQQSNNPNEASVGTPLDLLSVGTLLAARWRSLVAVPLLVGAAAVGASYLVKPTFTARTTFLPPQGQQSAASSALAALGSLTGLGGGNAMKSPGDQYIAFLQSNVIADRLISAFDLQQVYETDLHSLTRKALGDRSRMTAGKKDGVVVVEVDDKDPQRAADIANRYIDELRRLTSEIAVTEAQQRRAFFERHVQATRQNLANAQAALQGSLFDSGALKAEPKAAADAYAKLKAEATTLEVRLKVMRNSFSEDAPELRQVQSALGELRGQLSKLEQANQGGDKPADASYVSKYREYKYQETLFEMFSKQFELAKLDESREGLLIQVLDKADKPDHKSKPKRAQVGIGATAGTLLAMLLWILGRHSLAQAKAGDPRFAARLQGFKAAFRRQR